MQQQMITCLNGSFLEASEAKLPITDRGFRFGDGVFETIRLIKGVPYQWEMHMQRLKSGLEALRIPSPEVDWRHIAKQMMAQNKASEGYLRIAVSRGMGSHGYWPEIAIIPNWAMEYLSAITTPKKPCKLWLSSVRRPSIASLPVNDKLAHGIGSTLALLEARDHCCDEALMLSLSDEVSEAASGNIFWLKDNQFFTPALGSGCLSGTTRSALIRLTEVSEIHGSINNLLNADAAFICNVRLGLWPVAELLPNHKLFNADHPRIHELTALLDADYISYVSSHTKEWT